MFILHSVVSVMPEGRGDCGTHTQETMLAPFNFENYETDFVIFI